MFSVLINTWHYTINHKWSKDILRANILFILLVIIYDFMHFSLKIINWYVFFKVFILLNICLFFKFLLDGIDRYLKERQKL
ncbi:hypothetical protein H5S09_07145 [Limosilactobacillus sp. STM2_1]|uniref:Uncharacterized protein n=1 Tax=Limosilactobacillus rudii TaxID=2759755 RepID=A0A7W3ULJ8_9LACO|nr:hypothetical protein [Limosilactobacillus rudii]MBB1097716.1 hypothetical protein [Limosilactobacillus rudii]